MEVPTRGLRLLSIDGGGVRGLSALAILDQLMSRIDATSPPKPCDYFDMIGGTSTGGLIAIMLGRLQMSIKECIDAYVSLSDAIFQKKKHRLSLRGKTQGRFDHKELERCVKQIIAKTGRKEDILLEDGSESKCKVFVCAQSTHTGGTERVRSYRSGRARPKDIKIWEAARATSAATTFFEPLVLSSGESFVDGAIGANNPIFELWSEAKDVWISKTPGAPLSDSVKCVISIGTGVPSLSSFSSDIVDIAKMLKLIATETEATAERFARDKSDLGISGHYYRFNVDRGLENIGLENSSEKGAILAATGRYIEGELVYRQLVACADMLKCESLDECVDLLLRQVQGPTRDDLRHYKRCKTAFQQAECRDQYNKVKSFASSKWLVNDERFKEWERRDKGLLGHQDSHFLTLIGHPATGKSVLMRTAVDHMTQLKATNNIVLYHFFDRTKDNRAVLMRTSIEEFYCSLLFQLLDKLDPKPWTFLSKWSELLENLPETAPWAVASLQEAIFEVIFALDDPQTVQDKGFRIFIDAVNECVDTIHDSHLDSHPQQPLEILNFVTSLLKRALDTGVDVRVCISRQHLPSYGSHEPTTQTIVVENHNRPSIEQLINGGLAHIDDVFFRNELRQKILSRTTNEFLWPDFVLKQIAESHTLQQPVLLKLVDELPTELFGLYERLLSTGRPLQESRTLCLLQIVLGARRALSADELRHALAYCKEFTENPFDDIDEWEDSPGGFQSGVDFANYVQQESRGLLEIYPQTGNKSKVRFYHGTVSTFLTSESALSVLREDDLETWTKRYHLYMLRICLKVLDACSLRKNEKAPFFLDYATGNWVYHARVCADLITGLPEDALPEFLSDCGGAKAGRVIARQIQALEADGAIEYFPLKDEETLLVLLATLGCTHLLQYHVKDCESCQEACTEYSRDDTRLYRKALQNAITCGQMDTAKWMLDQHTGGDINSLYFDTTLLYKACYFNHHDLVALLLSTGADPTVQCNRLYEFALHAAVECGLNRIVKELVKSTHVNKERLYKIQRQGNGRTALHCAVASLKSKEPKLAVLNTILSNAPRGVGLLEIKDKEGLDVMSLARRLSEDGESGAIDVEEALEDFASRDRKARKKLMAEKKDEVSANTTEVAIR